MIKTNYVVVVGDTCVAECVNSHIAGILTKGIIEDMNNQPNVRVSFYKQTFEVADPKPIKEKKVVAKKEPTNEDLKKKN